MGYNKNKYTFWQLISEKKIVIPIIQRDYAQGRKGKEYIRKSFLEQLGNAILKNESIELDFVYGTEKDKIMYPLDGQQRLTTLWLLHWYVAYNAGKINLASFTEDEKKKLKDRSVKPEDFEASKQEIVKTINTLKKFSYETRTSSREFCEKLCELEYKKTDHIVKHIISQTWFFSTWKQDPTIQAMLRMLGGTNNTNSQDKEFVDGIEKLFEDYKDFPSYWNFLTEKDQITFNFLPLNSNEIPVSDDLYIKMNARGKALTSFENFKADLIGWMKDSSNPESEFFNKLIDYDGREMPYALAFSCNIDNKWTDIFWENGKDLGRVDEIYFAFFNRYFYNLTITKEGLKDDNASHDIYYDYFSDLKNTKDNDKKITYTSFNLYKHFLNSGIINDIYTILNNFYSAFRKCKNIHDILGCSWNKDFHFIPEYCKDDEGWKRIDDNAGNKIYEVTTLNQMERVVFYAICKYFKSGTTDEDGSSLKNWMRFIWNLVSDYDGNDTPAIRSIGAMQAAISLIDKIHNPLDIYNELKHLKEEPLKSEINNRFNEEIAKAKQILEKKANANAIGPDETQIIEAENYAFFKGAIRFLFTSENGIMDDWGNFSKKWENAKKYFNVNGLTEYGQKEAIANRILLSYCNDWEKQIQSSSHNDKFIFSYSIATWRNNILMRTNIYPMPIHNLLMGKSLCNSISLVNNNIQCNTAFDRIVNTNLIAKINTGHYGNRDKYYIRWSHDGLSLYPSSTGIILTLNNRDKFLSELIESKKIEITEGKLLDTLPIKMFYGWYIGFVYKEHTFRWQYWNWIDMYEIDKRLEDYLEYQNQCIIDGEKILNLNDLVTKLDHCIDNYEKIKHQKVIEKN